jgi:7-cyano-7-deazaguanine synthase
MTFNTRILLSPDIEEGVRVVRPSSAVVLASGGMDSSSLLAYLNAKGWGITPISFNYGGKHNDVEYEALKEVCAHLDIKEPLRIDLTFVNQYFRSDLLQSGGNIPHGHYMSETMKQTVVPGRNAIMLSIAAGLAESLGVPNIAYANHAGDHAVYPDCRPAFVMSMDLTLFHSSDGKVSLYAPFTDIDKAQICRIGFEFGAPLWKTWSCYEGMPPMHCGDCSSCGERHWAFLKARVPDNTQYLGNPMKHFTQKELEDLGIDGTVGN